MNNDETLIDPSGAENPSNTSASFPYPINRRYQCQRLLGKGGNGAVYQAYDTQLQRDVAIKFVNAATRVARERFINEARLLAHVEHDRIVKVFEVAEEGDALYMVMQLIGGDTLYAYREQMSMRQKVEAIAQIASGLGEVHQRGVVHRDIKPGNILLTTPPAPKQSVSATLVDFGIAAHTERSSLGIQPGQGSLFYMAPEQAAPEGAEGIADAWQFIGPSADVYSLGATLYFMLSGEPAIVVAATTEIVNKIQRSDILPLKRQSPELPSDLCDIVMHCLQREPNARYANAAALADDLQRWLRCLPTSLNRGVGERLRLWYKRAPWTSGIITSLFAAAIMASVGFAVYHSRLNERDAALQQFVEQVKDVESRVRFIQMSPVSEISDDYQQLQQTATELVHTADNKSAFFAGPAYYAAGKTALALNQPQRALQLLNKGWQSGYQDGRMALALARTHTELYRSGQREAASIVRPEERQAFIAELQQKHQQPALHYLQRSLASQQQSELPKDYLTALTQYLAGNLDKADTTLANGQFASWFYEPLALRTTIALERIMAARAESNWEQMQAHYKAIAPVFDRLHQIAPSYFDSYSVEGAIVLQMGLQAKQSEAAGKQWVEKMQSLANTMLALAPDHPYSAYYKGLAVSLSNDQKELTYDNNIDDFSRSVWWYEKALTLSKQKIGQEGMGTEIRLQLLKDLGLLASKLGMIGKSSLSALKRMQSVASDIPASRKNYFFYYTLANQYQQLLDFQYSRGLNNAEITKTFKLADANYRRAIELAPGRFGLEVNYAKFLLEAGFEQGYPENTATLEAAYQHILQANKLNPDNWVVNAYLIKIVRHIITNPPSSATLEPSRYDLNGAFDIVAPYMAKSTFVTNELLFITSFCAHNDGQCPINEVNRHKISAFEAQPNTFSPLINTIKLGAELAEALNTEQQRDILAAFIGSAREARDTASTPMSIDMWLYAEAITRYLSADKVAIQQWFELLKQRKVDALSEANQVYAIELLADAFETIDWNQKPLRLAPSKAAISRFQANAMRYRIQHWSQIMLINKLVDLQ